jgi:tight adherence protein B
MRQCGHVRPASARAWLAIPVVLLASLALPLAALAAQLALPSRSPGLTAAQAAPAAPNPARVVMILLDRNGSPPSLRLAAEQQAALDFASALPADVEVGLITFSDGWKTVLAPSGDRKRLAAAIAAARPAGATSNGIAGALTGAVADIGRVGAAAHARLLVLSNGESLNHQVRPVAIPTDVVSWYNDSDDFPAMVRRLATAGGGHIASPAHAATLAAAFPPLATPPVSPSASAVPAASQTPAAAPAAGSGSHLPISLLGVLAAVFIALLALALLTVGSVRSDGRRRPRLLGQIERYGPMRTPPPEQASDGRVARTAVGLMTQLLQSRDTGPKLALRLDHAGISRQPAEWALLCASVSVVLAAVLTLLTASPLIGILAGVLIGWICMRLVLSIKIARRRAAFDEQLPNVLQLVAGSLQTGFSVAQAIDAVVREEAQPAAGEFARALTETRLGVDLDVALDGVADRLASTDLRWVVMAIRIQRETGGNLAEVIRNTVGTMRERAYLRRQVRSLSAEGRLSAYVLLALPVVVGGWLMFSSPNYMRPLYTTVFGVLMLTIATLLIVAGAFWMRKLINVEV